MRRFLGRLAIVLEVFAFFALGSIALRGALLVTYAESPSIPTLLRVFTAGLQFDTTAGLLLLLPQTLLLTVTSEGILACKPSRVLLQVMWLGGFVALPFLWVAEWLFFAEFDCRLNYIAFEYLVYPQEVCCNIWQSYPIVPVLVAIGAVGVSSFWLLRARFLTALSAPLPRPRRFGLLAAYLAATAGLCAATSMERMDVSADRVVNECANAGMYSFCHYARTCRFNFDQLYLTLPQNEAEAILQRSVPARGEVLQANSTNPIDRAVHSGKPRTDYNVVVILEESLGADFVGVLGDDRALTPEFDRLAEQGLLFDNFYATGNRTARALEAVLASLPPIPTESILKRDHSERVYTLANVLAGRGYECLFMTGGRGIFDGVRSFMRSNGFERFIEQSDYEDPVFTNAWGVSDEDLFRRAVDECDRMHASGRPFFSMLLTVSNHRPFTFPAGRVPVEQGSREHAVRYADWALGEFFRLAKRRPFYDRTIFIVAGDHGARVYGAQLFPIRSYRVPMLIIHPEAAHQGERCSTLACSLDVGPTILGLLGGSYRSTFFGRDILQMRPEEGRALMQHNHDVARLEADGKMIVLGARKRVSGFRLASETGDLISNNLLPKDSVDELIAWFQSAYELYYGERCWPAAPTITSGDTAPRS